MTFELILEEVGKFGRYQKCLTFLLCMPLLLGSCQLFVQVFAAGKSDHWCQSWDNDVCDDLNLTENSCNDIVKEVSIPLIPNSGNKTIYEQCEKYNVTGMDFETVVFTGARNMSLEKIPCDKGWHFDRRIFRSTIIIDFELVCGKSYLPNIAQSAYFAGVLVGSIFGGISSDILGVRRTVLGSSVLVGAAGIANSFAPNIAVYIVLRFMVASFSRALSLSTYVLAMEIVSPSKRSVVGNALFVFFGLGYILLAGCAWLASSWRILQLVVSLPFLPLIILALLFVPESPRWQISKGRYEEAEKMLKKIAKINGHEVSGNFMEESKEINEQNQPSMKESLKVLLRSRICLLITFNMCFNWGVQSLVFYGLSLTTSTLGIDPYLSFIISGAIEIPAYIVCIFLAELLGRKAATVLTMLVAGICCCILPVLPLGIWRVLLATVGKFCVTISFSVVYIWAAELSPTPLRSSGMGLFSMSSRIGGILVPFLLILGDIWPSLPVVVIGGFSIAAGLLALFFPETKGKPMPSTILDTENIFRNEERFK